ncbi:MAG: amidohydrolase family protein, partial [Verrucomicrobia bacterium]|nr:amidohydrolase family protein [Verrucomicrobiota bacterium]
PVDIKDPWPSVDAKQDFYDVLRRDYGGFINAPESQLHFANLRRMRELGTRFIVGSDAGAGMTRFQDLWLCIAVFVASLEFSVVEAIQSATQLAAKALKVDHDLGTIEAGKLADIVVVAGNPVDDGVWTLREVEIVIKDGRTVVERSTAVDQIAMNRL